MNPAITMDGAITALVDQDHLNQILVKHARVAHVRVSDKRRHCMHSPVAGPLVGELPQVVVQGREGPG